MSSADIRPDDRRAAETLAALADLMERLARCADLDEVLTTSLESLDSLFHFRYSMFMMLDETGSSLYTIASHGYDQAGIGSLDKSSTRDLTHRTSNQSKRPMPFFGLSARISNFAARGTLNRRGGPR